MNKTILFLFLLSLSAGSYANVYEDKIEQTELANALIQCSTSTANLLTGRAYVSSVEGKFVKVSKTVNTKTYTIETREPRGFGMSVPGPSLIIKHKLTSPPAGSADMPSRSEFSCTVK